MPKSHNILLLAINLTSRCNLACQHCYLDANTLQHGNSNELTTTEICYLLNNIAQRSSETMIVLTGGEPLIRNDIETLIKQGVQIGLTMVIGTNGMLLTEKRVLSLKNAGLLGVGISLDSLNSSYHDKLRGQQGGWNKTMIGIENCRKHNLSFQLHFSITDDNADELPAMIDFARKKGAMVLNIFFLVCTGRGRFMSNINPTRYEEILIYLIDIQSKIQDLIIRPRCVPHYKRIAHQRQPDSFLNKISGMEGDGCIAGIHYCRITPTGGITACPYIPLEVGNIRQQSFWDIWDNEFAELRTPKLQGNCGNCEYQKLCGGCRARPVAAGDSLMDADKLCTYQPQGKPVIQPLLNLNVQWSPEAEQRITRIPAFLRKMVKKRAEAYVAGLGESLVTPEHLKTLSARRFGGKPKI
ncbi:radical SAM protein [Candidatus Halobeggiatoa sp. HSG11]|nr:radical SAM protein [Candidatus Halobeggiatoa sp. HSG11]